MSYSATVKNALKVSSFLLVLACPLSSYAKAGCCSHHGGVSGCDVSSGHQMCRDGTASPSCPCGNAASTATTAPTAVKTKPVKTAPRSSSRQENAPVLKTTPVSTKGCCSRHGGVASCNKMSGYFMCKDGSQSSTCACH